VTNALNKFSGNASQVTTHRIGGRQSHGLFHACFLGGGDSTVAQAFRLSTFLELEAELARAVAAGDHARVVAVEEPLSEQELLALERAPCGERQETQREVRDRLFAASRRATNRTGPPIDVALCLADAENFGVDLLVALRDVGAACVGDDEEPIFPQQIAANCLRALTRLRVV
jgi:hypothetical protein